MIPIETRVANLENLVHALSQKIDNNKYYTDADMQGNRQSISNVTPYTETKTAYIGDTEISFDNVPSGNLSVFADNISEYRTDRVGSTLNIDFIKPLEEVTEVTISIQ
jgi:hypothetical protein